MWEVVSTLNSIISPENKNNVNEKKKKENNLFEPSSKSSNITESTDLMLSNITNFSQYEHEAYESNTSSQNITNLISDVVRADYIQVNNSVIGKKMKLSKKSNSWQNKLISNRGEFPTLKQQKIIEENFNREDIFSHQYNVNDLFKMFYKVSPENSQNVIPKRQPNPFMILRAVLGLVANDKNIKSKIGDGTEQSKLASYIWGGADENEKAKFEELCSEFKNLHQQLFPNYVYKPTPRNTKVGSVVDIEMATS
jgi:hypothetical protein